MASTSNNGNLPKFLVRKFGEDTVRQLCGLPSEPSEKMMRKRTAKAKCE